MIENQTKNSWELTHGEKCLPGLEHQLVLAAVSLDRIRDDRILEILDVHLNWTLVQQFAIQNGVFPLVYQRIMSSAEKQLPMEEISQWKELFLLNTQNNLRLTWKLIECIKLLLNHGIECIVLKGPVYALQAYNDFNLRQYSDMDILIDRTSLIKANEVLERSGYIPTFKLDARQKKYLLRLNDQFSYTIQRDIVEVHWNIDAPGNIFHYAPGQRIPNLTTINILDQDVYTLSQEDTIIYMCVHGAKHGWSQLKLIVDLAYLSRSVTENSWLTLMDRTKRLGLHRQICLGLLLATDLVDTELPGALLNQLNSNRAAQKLASQVKVRLLKLTHDQSPNNAYKFYWMSLERWRDRAHYLNNLIFVPDEADWKTISLPEYLYFFYYLIRPVRLLIKYGISGIKKSQRDTSLKV
jgi:hypothetical protein